MKKSFYLIVVLTFCLLPVLFFTTSAGCSGLDARETGKRVNGYNPPNDPFDYNSAWKDVEGFINKRLPKSALETVEKIYAKAKAKNNAAELVKALIHKLQLIQAVEEDPFVKIQTELMTELKTSKFPVTPVLHSMLAEQYWKYYQNNRYRLMNRSATTENKPNDLRTWDLKTIVTEVVTHYKKSLEHPEASQKTKIDVYDTILLKQPENRKYRPTLYDFLAHRAVDFFSNSEAGLTQPVYRFTLNKNEYFSKCKTFAQNEITSRDPLSFHFFALKGLQELIRFHLNDSNSEALVDADLKRLRFVYKNAVINDKEIIYENALRALMRRHDNVQVVAEVYYELAMLYSELGDKYKPGTNKKYKWHKKKALELCTEAIKKYPDSTGAQNCNFLKGYILRKQIDIAMENATIPNQQFLGHLQYKNTNRIYFKIVPVDRKEINEKKRLRKEDMAAYLVGKDPLNKWKISTPNDGDYQSHALEFQIDPLPQGLYVLLASDNENFDLKNHAVSFGIFSVTRIAYIHRTRVKRGLDFYLLDRDTGQPLTEGRAQVWFQEYNRSLRRYEPQKGPLYEADENGYFNISHSNLQKYNFNLELINGSDSLYCQRNFYLNRPYDPTQQRKRTFFFTDRSIYRPGQTVYFKGIILLTDNTDGENNRILANRSTQVQLLDVNRQKVAQLNLVSNEFGTFSGSFQLPEGQLNGNMTIKDNYGTCNFSVEEYKRPKFKVTFAPQKESFKLGDTVTIKGKAEAYAGYNIDNADVKYRVVRRAFYPYRWRCWWYTPPAPQMEILNGITKTDAKGDFEVTFKALPDRTLDRALEPGFYFTVHADVTDINGETRSGSKSTAVGYTALKLDINLPEQMDKNAGDQTFNLTTTNLSGEFIPTEGKISFYRLKDSPRLCREKLWPQPDRHIIKKDDYYKLFPHDDYDNESDYHRWEKQKTVFNGGFDTGEVKELSIKGLKKWQPGKYLVEMTAKDKYGSSVKAIRYFTLYSSREKEMPYKQSHWLTIPNSVVEPGDKAVILVGSSAKNVRVVYEVELRRKVITKQYFTLNNEQKRIEIPIEEKHRGNFTVHFAFVKHNRVFREYHTIMVPWSNKNLDISFETFRNKLKPGEKEEWRIKIRGKKGPNGKTDETAVAEMVASLYDASLDAFRGHTWSFNVFPHLYNTFYWQTNPYFAVSNSQVVGVLGKSSSYTMKYYDQLNWFGFNWYDHLAYFGKKSRPRPAPSVAIAESTRREPFYDKMDGKVNKRGYLASSKSRLGSNEKKEMEADDAAGELSTTVGDKSVGEPEAENKGTGPDLSQIKARTNLQETAFFYPHLKTDAEGTIIVSFTIPEALTKWKMLGFAHDKNLRYGLVTKELVTQKELMVVPNVPRFFREGDTLALSAKITNLTQEERVGKAKLMLFDATSMQPVDADFKNTESEKAFEIPKEQSTRVDWRIRIPDDIDAVTYRIVAAAGKFSDGEEQAVPILKNRMMVTETLPLPVRGGEEKTFTMKKLVDSSQSSTLRHHKLTLEFTANPVWYAIQALPYLMEYPHECMEQVFSRYYANGIAAHIVNSNPKIKRVFEIWKSATDSNALLSNLEKNQELKGLLLRETPWVLNAQDETQRKKRVALLFDINKMATQADEALKKLKEGQMPSGGWPWFKGMRESRYITAHIVCGLAHMHALKVIDAGQNKKIRPMLEEAVRFLDRQVRDDYRWLLDHKKDLTKQHISYDHIHYLYTRSYFKDIPMHEDCKTAFQYYKGQAATYWTRFNFYSQGMMALALQRYGQKDTVEAIVRSIKEHALHSEEMGMYWKGTSGYYWYQLPIETQALLIEVFDEVTGDGQAVEDMRTWLLKQKQVQDWRTTKATADACYALLLRGENWLEDSTLPEITLGKKKKINIEPDKMENVNVEAGTGYFKKSWGRGEMTADMGHVTVKNNNKSVAWGSLYWQYFENLDKITPAETPLKLKKELFIEKPSDTGPVLHPLGKSIPEVGDRIKVRIELQVDRDMEFVHMKDMRAAGFEPENVISRYKWQDGLGYYESTGDASTNFFFSYLPKGTYVFEYPLRVNHAGDFSNGITTIQCMYAPEFSSHSQGIRVVVK